MTTRIEGFLSLDKILLEGNVERLLTNVTIKVVEDIEKADGERFQNLTYNFGTGSGKVEEVISYSQLVGHLEATANKENETNDDHTSSEH